MAGKWRRRPSAGWSASWVCDGSVIPPSNAWECTTIPKYPQGVHQSRRSVLSAHPHPVGGSGGLWFDADCGDDNEFRGACVLEGVGDVWYPPKTEGRQCDRPVERSFPELSSHSRSFLLSFLFLALLLSFSLIVRRPVPTLPIPELTRQSSGTWRPSSGRTGHGTFSFYLVHRGRGREHMDPKLKTSSAFHNSVPAICSDRPWPIGPPWASKPRPS